MTSEPIYLAALGDDDDAACWPGRSRPCAPRPTPRRSSRRRAARRGRPSASASGCEVKGECLEYALGQDERFGIWGGLSERERRRLKRAPAGLPAQRAGPRSVRRRVDLVRVELEQPRDLVDHDVVHEVGEVAAVGGPGLQRPPVDDDPRGGRPAAAVDARPAAAGRAAPRRRPCRRPARRRRSDRVAVERARPARPRRRTPRPRAPRAQRVLELLDRVEDQVVEALAAGLRGRHPQRAAAERRPSRAPAGRADRARGGRAAGAAARPGRRARRASGSTRRG